MVPGGACCVGRFARVWRRRGGGVCQESLLGLGVGVAGSQVEAQGLPWAEALAGLGGEPGAAGTHHVAVDSGDVVRIAQGIADVGLTELRLQLFGELDADADDGIIHMLAGDGVQDALRGIVAETDLGVYSDEGPGVHGVEVEAGESRALGFLLVEVYGARTRVFALF